VLVVDLCLPESASLPTGIPDALGCSGAPAMLPPALDAGTPLPSWRELYLSVPTALESGAPLRVATDGFFQLGARTRGLSADQTLAQLRVRVLDAAGAEHEGDLQLLLETSDGFHLFGWTARAPFALGDRLSVVLSADPSTSGAADVGGTFALSVVEPPPQLSAPELVLGRWTRFYQGVGEDVLTCRSLYPCGGNPSFSVPGRLVERMAVELSWVPPAHASPVAWQLHWQADQSSTGPETAWMYWGHGEHAPKLIGSVVLPDINEQHCVSLLIEDVRSGETRRSEVCAEPGPLEGFWSDTLLRQCPEPPSAELTRAWCNLRGGVSDEPRCADVLTQESAPGSDVVASPDPGPRESSGCQLGGAGSAHTLAGTLLGSVALWLARRRRR
jgi:hypothetical protein